MNEIFISFCALQFFILFHFPDNLKSVTLSNANSESAEAPVDTDRIDHTLTVALSNNILGIVLFFLLI